MYLRYSEIDDAFEDPISVSLSCSEADEGGHVLSCSM